MANIDQVISKLSDPNLQGRLSLAARSATMKQLKDEGIDLSPEEWGEVCARLVAPQKGAGDVLAGAAVAVLFSDRRLKTNVVLRETLANGLRIFEFSYRSFTSRWRGVMAQDVLQSHPEAVSTDESGYLMVDYRRLGISMQAA